MNKIKVLILDDDDSLRYNLKIFLEDEGFLCTAVDHPAEALDLMRYNKYDVAIVDIRLPGISGDEFISIACKNHMQNKFIIYTGSMDFILTPELSALGMTIEDIMRKPVEDMTDFTVRIKTKAAQENDVF